MLYFPPVINWTSLLFSALWILGLSVLLAGLSYHSWQAAELKRPLSSQLNQSSFLRIAWVGMALIAAGLVGAGPWGWETAVWLLILGVSLVNIAKNGQ